MVMYHEEDANSSALTSPEAAIGVPDADSYKEPTPQDLITFFPEFADTPTETIAIWLKVARNFVNRDRWGETYRLGVCLFAAHQLSIAARNARVASTGGLPGSAIGVVGSRSVGSVSKSIDTGTGQYAGAGFWNLTTYGQQYWGFAQLFGAGGMQL